MCARSRAGSLLRRSRESRVNAHVLTGLSEPPGVIADLGGFLAPHVKQLVRAGWIVCVASSDERIVRRASQDGAQDARPSSMTHAWPDNHFDVVFSSSDMLEEAERIRCNEGVIIHQS